MFPLLPLRLQPLPTELRVHAVLRVRFAFDSVQVLVWPHVSSASNPAAMPPEQVQSLFAQDETLKNKFFEKAKTVIDIIAGKTGLPTGLNGLRFENVGSIAFRALAPASEVQRLIARGTRGQTAELLASLVRASLEESDLDAAGEEEAPETERELQEGSEPEIWDFAF